MPLRAIDPFHALQRWRCAFFCAPHKPLSRHPDRVCVEGFRFATKFSGPPACASGRAEQRRPLRASERPGIGRRTVEYLGCAVCYTCSSSSQFVLRQTLGSWRGRLLQKQIHPELIHGRDGLSACFFKLPDLSALWHPSRFQNVSEFHSFTSVGHESGTSPRNLAHSDSLRHSQPTVSASPDPLPNRPEKSSSPTQTPKRSESTTHSCVQWLDSGFGCAPPRRWSPPSMCSPYTPPCTVPPQHVPLPSTTADNAP